MRRDVSLFLERHGHHLGAEHLALFHHLRGDYEVNFHLERLTAAVCPSPAQLSAQHSRANNRRLAQMRREAERIVPDADGRDDAAALEKRLCDAATWGHADVVSDLLRTCYVTRAVAVPALGEAASKGNVDVVKVFVVADSRMAFALHAKYGKNALHAAAERGHEAVLSVLVECAKERADLYGIKEAARGMSVLQLLRANDMNGLARRIGTLAKRLFTPVRHVRSATLEDALDIFTLVNRAYSVEIGDEGLAFKTTDRFENIEEVHGMIEDFVLLVEEEAEE